MLRIKNFLKLGIFSALLLLLLAACSDKEKLSGTTNEEKDVKITFFNTSAEVNTEFEDLFKKYTELHPNVTIELIPTPIGGQQIEKLQSLLASGTPATIANLDPGTIVQYKDKFLDLESEKANYEKLTNPG